MAYYKVIFEGYYGDMTTFTDVVKADNAIEALFKAEGAEYCFDEKCWNDDGIDLDKIPKTFKEAEKMADKNDRKIQCTIFNKSHFL